MQPHATRLQESTGYEQARDQLRRAEAELLRQCERVAELRRALPAGTELPDYVLEEASGPGDALETVRLSGLFSGAERPLIVYHFMFGKAQPAPCPMCTLWTDGFNAVAPHLAERADFAIVAACGARELRRFGLARGWTNLRLLGAGDSAFKYDLGSEDSAGDQSPAISVFLGSAGGSVRHFYTGGAQLLEGQHRGLDLLTPLWHLLDLTPDGRGDWMPHVDEPPVEGLGRPFQPDPEVITWRMHLRSPVSAVYTVLTTDAGRAAFWAERTTQRGDRIDFEFPGGLTGQSRVLASEPDRLWRIDYFDAVVTFELTPAEDGGTDLRLVTHGFAPRDRDELLAGWLNVLFPLKAYVDHGVDLRNHDDSRTWWDGYADQ